MPDANGKNAGDDGYDGTTDPQSPQYVAPTLPGAKDNTAAADKALQDRTNLRQMLASLGITLPVTETDLSEVSNKLLALQKQTGDALINLLNGGGILGGGADYSAKLQTLINAQDQLKSVGDLFSNYAATYQANGPKGPDKSDMTLTQAQKYLGPDDYRSYLVAQGYSGDRLQAEISDYNAANDAANSKTSDMTLAQAQKYKNPDEFAQYLADHNITGERAAAEMKDYQDANQTASQTAEDKANALSEPTLAMAQKYMSASQFGSYLQNVLHYTGDKYNEEILAYNDAHQAAQSGQSGQSGQQAGSASGSAAGQNGSAGGTDQTQPYGPGSPFYKGMQQAIPPVVKLPTSQEFLSNFTNAFDTKLTELAAQDRNTPGTTSALGGGLTPQMEFARSVMMPALMSKYMGTLGQMSQPYQAVEDQYGSPGGSVNADKLTKAGISRTATALPSLDPMTFLAGELTPGKIELAYEGSKSGAGGNLSGAGGEVARRV